MLAKPDFVFKNSWQKLDSD